MLQNNLFPNKPEEDQAHNDDDSILIANTNNILTSVGIAFKQIFSIEELTRVAPSMFVAVVESLYKIKIDGIIRNPQTKVDYINNAQLMVDILGDQLRVDLSHITGEMIVDGNKEALSNLVNIFMRLLNLNGNLSIPSLGSNNKDEEEVNRRFSYPSADSISTKDSLLMPKRSVTGPRQKYNRKYQFQMNSGTLPYYQQSPEQLFAQRFLNNMFHKSEKLLDSDMKQFQAKRRRYQSERFRGEILQRRNTTKHAKTKRALEERWKKETMQAQKSFDLRSKNEEVVALRKIYAVLFREVAKRRAEERRQQKASIKDLKLKLESEVESLDRLYREKLNLLEEEANYQRVFSKSDYEEILKNLSSTLESRLEKQKNLLHQRKERELQWKREACQQLLLSMEGIKWEDLLRVYH